MSTELEAAELLEKAADTLQTSGWCQWILVKGSGEHCAIGGLLTAGDVNRWNWFDRPHLNQALWSLAKAAKLIPRDAPTKNWDNIVGWNNADERTAEEVIDAMKQAAKDLRNEAGP